MGEVWVFCEFERDFFFSSGGGVFSWLWTFETLGGGGGCTEKRLGSGVLGLECGEWAI